jgi:hypothetical protein
MNGKKAKALRRIAHQQTVGFEELKHLPAVSQFTKDLDALRGKISSSQSIVDATCTRGVGKFLKKELKRGAMSLRRGPPL